MAISWRCPWLSPLPALSLETAGGWGWVVDWQLAALRNERELCSRVLQPPNIEAAAVSDNPLKDGCGWVNSVRLSAAGGARIPADKISCPAAAAFALWMTHEVQPLALSFLGKRVVAVQQMGTYSCRNIIGNPFWKYKRSEHATANAIDIGSFTLEDGRRVSVLNHWSGSGNEALFLKAVHQRACRYFRVAIGPDFNVSHKNHFHFDRGILSRCK